MLTHAHRPRDTFWAEAFAIHGSVAPVVARNALIFTLLALVVYLLDAATHRINLGVDLAPYEVAGAALGLVLVLRTNAGYDRWWEGRRLWGGIINQSRTLATSALTFGPDDPRWRDELMRWLASYAHVSRHTLRGERDLPSVAALVGPEASARIAAARHMPTAVSLEIARLLRAGVENAGAHSLAFLPAEEARNQLLDHIGGCERIVKSPLPRVYGIEIRRFIFLFLATLPFALLPRVQWLTPFTTLLIAYPILALDQIGVSLQNPFDPDDLGALPLDEICASIEAELLALSAAAPSARPGGPIS